MNMERVQEIAEDLRVKNYKPIYIHDCDSCIFLGHMLHYDWYAHIGNSFCAIIWRYGNEGVKYSSLPSFIEPTQPTIEERLAKVLINHFIGSYENPASV